MEKIKSFFSSITGVVLTILGIIGAIGTYLFIRKQEENEALKTKLALAETQKDVDVIEVEIKQKLEDRKLNKEQQNSLQRDLDVLEKKRSEIKTEATDSEIENFWNKK